ncbi:uracil-DNA glycosylase [Clostridium sp. LBM24168]
MDINNYLKEKIRLICEDYTDSPIGGYITGDGPIPCDILFIGEAPGKMEIIEGRPFVGMAGKNFEKYLTSIGLIRNKVRITNTCFFRPIKITRGKNGRNSVKNRTPKVSEINLFKDILKEEINFVNPKIIITLGNVPLKSLTEFKSIGECHGKLFFNIELKMHIFPMYHPSSLTYNRNEDFKNMYNGDWLKLKETLTKI